MAPRSILLLLLSAFTTAAATPATAGSDEQAVRAADARYWQAYNACDMAAMGELLTDDVEFYHDRTGLTAGRPAVLDSLRNGPCASPRTMTLRREAIENSIRFHPLAGGFALLSGAHSFYVTDAGKPERLDGQAEFVIVWQSVDGHWRMRRILSYAHGPVAYIPLATHLTLSPATLAAFAGHYAGNHVGDIVVAVDGDGLKLTAGSFVATLRAETPTRFFAPERDLRFEFAPADDGNSPALDVYENGALTETATRKK